MEVGIPDEGPEAPQSANLPDAPDAPDAPDSPELSKPRKGAGRAAKWTLAAVGAGFRRAQAFGRRHCFSRHGGRAAPPHAHAAQASGHVLRRRGPQAVARRDMRRAVAKETRRLRHALHAHKAVARRDRTAQQPAHRERPRTGLQADRQVVGRCVRLLSATCRPVVRQMSAAVFAFCVNRYYLCAVFTA